MRCSTRRLQRLTVTLAAVFTALALTLLPSGTAQAQEPVLEQRPVTGLIPDPDLGNTAANPPCDQVGNTTATADEGLSFRRAPDPNALRDGIIPAGTTVPWCGYTSNGGAYNACGATGWTLWDRVNWNGQSGWVVSACVTLND